MDLPGQGSSQLLGLGQVPFRVVVGSDTRWNRRCPLATLIWLILGTQAALSPTSETPGKGDGGMLAVAAGERHVLGDVQGGTEQVVAEQGAGIGRVGIRLPGAAWRAVAPGTFPAFYQPEVPGPPLNGPTIAEVTQPP